MVGVTFACAPSTARDIDFRAHAIKTLRATHATRCTMDGATCVVYLHVMRVIPACCHDRACSQQARISVTRRSSGMIGCSNGVPTRKLYGSNRWIPKRMWRVSPLASSSIVAVVVCIGRSLTLESWSQSSLGIPRRNIPPCAPYSSFSIPYRIDTKRANLLETRGVSRITHAVVMGHWVISYPYSAAGTDRHAGFSLIQAASHEG